MEAEQETKKKVIMFRCKVCNAIIAEEFLELHKEHTCHEEFEPLFFIRKQKGDS